MLLYSGKILHIDFGDCFEASMNREKFPEKVMWPHFKCLMFDFLHLFHSTIFFSCVYLQIMARLQQCEQFLFIKFGVCQPAVPPQEQPNDVGGIDSIDTS